MDAFTLAVFVGLTILSCVPLDWKKDPRSAALQFALMIITIIALLAYTAWR